jgi:A/G-specific adenine glycosylase
MAAAPKRKGGRTKVGAGTARGPKAQSYPNRRDSGRSDAVSPGDAALVGAVESWFRGASRDLPWRRIRTPYTTLVSEAMLQQTQVSRVVGRFEAFLERFPDLASLAAASEQAVLAAWQGLGYYRRARNLHAAAKAVVERHAGEVPAEIAALRALPGIGAYTAGAIASIGHGRTAAIVDTNVARVLLRVAGRPGSTADPASMRWCWERAESLVRLAESPSRLNEGLMELGSTVCTKASPRCGECPLRERCVARREGTVDRIPAAKPPVARQRVYFHAAVCVRDGRILLERRGEGGLWSGLWQPPTVEGGRKLAAAEVEKRLGVGKLSPRGEFEHRTSHRDVTFKLFDARGGRAGAGREWVERGRLADFPLSNPMRRLAAEALMPAPRRPRA